MNEPISERIGDRLDAPVHSAFYRYVALADPAAMADALRQLGARLGAPQDLGGSVIVAAEGINAVVAGTPAAVDAYEQALSREPVFAPFHALVFKRSACRTWPFGRYKVAHKAELVAIDLPEAADRHGQIDEHDDSHVAPADWDALIARPDVVLLDNRNHFEFRLGHFRGAVDPGVDNFRDFAAHVQAHGEAWRAAGKTVAMYCTGGIRCDRTAPWMRSLGLEVKQLQGGILAYLAEQAASPDKTDEHAWIGHCHVFDRRLALDATLAETGLKPEQVYDPTRPDEAWRLARAQRLDGDPT